MYRPYEGDISYIYHSRWYRDMGDILGKWQFSRCLDILIPWLSAGLVLVRHLVHCRVYINPGGTMISSDLAKLMNDTIWSLQWRHNERHGVSNHRHLACFFHLLFRQPSKKTSKLRVIGLCEGNPAVTSNAKNVSICWPHHVNYCHTKSLLPDFEKYVFSTMISGILPGLLYGVRISLINDGSPSFYLANCRQSYYISMVSCKTAVAKMLTHWSVWVSAVLHSAIDNLFGTFEGAGY